MNKYFLSLMSILILFQSFKVADEIFSHKDEGTKGYVILEEDEEDTEPVEDAKKEEKQDIDFQSIFTNANLDNGKKIAKQCVACHSFDNSLKIKVGPPLWGIVNRKAAIIDGFNYSDALTAYGKAWSKEELFYFLGKTKRLYKRN